MVNNKTSKFFIIFIGVVVLALVLKALEDFMFPLALGIVFTLLLLPLVKISKKLKIPFWIFGIGMVVIMVISTIVCISLLKIEGKKITSNFSEYREQVNIIYESYSKISRSVGFEPAEFETIVNLDIIKSGFSKFIKGVGSFLFNIFLGIIITVFIISSYPEMIKLLENKEGKINKKFDESLLKIEKSIRDYIYAKSLISLGTSVLSVIALFFFGGDFLFISFFILFTMHYIPNIGPIIAIGIVMILFVLKVGIVWNVLFLLIILIFIHLIFAFFIEPKFTAHKMSMSPILVLCSLFIWGWIWGVGGMIIAVPLTSILKIVFENLESTKEYCKYFN